MADYVVDTNVWIMVDKSLEDVTTQTELDCIEACRQWLAAFMKSADRLVVDADYQILGEYRTYAKPSRQLANSWLNQLERAPRNKLVYIENIQYDDHSHAIIPFDLDRKDRKFVAVALAHKPKPPIVTATDTDWDEAKDRLKAVGLTVIELCPDYIAEKRAQK